MAHSDDLGALEQKVLATTHALRDDAYGITIWREIVNLTGRDVAVGAIYATLDRLEGKGYLASRWGEAMTSRGGRRRRYFELTDAGTAVLRENWRVSDRLRRRVGMMDLTERSRTPRRCR